MRVGLDELLDRLGGDERDVAGEHDDRPRRASSSGSAASTAPPVPSGSGCDGGLDAVGQAAVEVASGRGDDDDALGPRLAGGDHRPADHRPPAELVQDLGRGGPHPRPLSGGHDDGGGGGHGAEG